MKNCDEAYAIVRFDGFLTEKSEQVSVKRIMWDWNEAKKEVHRLMGLPTRPTGTFYFVQTTRVDRRS